MAKTQSDYEFLKDIAAALNDERFTQIVEKFEAMEALCLKMKRGCAGLVFNGVRCVCGNVIVSTHVHDFYTCKCGATSVDGGLDYLKRSFEKPNFKELSLSVKDGCVVHHG